MTPTPIHDSGSDTVNSYFDSTDNGWHIVDFDWNGWQFQLQMAMVENKLTSNNNGRQEVEFDW